MQTNRQLATANRLGTAYSHLKRGLAKNLVKQTFAIIIVSTCTAAQADTYFVERPTTYIDSSVQRSGDSQFFTFRVDRNTVRGYSANGKTVVLDGSGIDNLQLVNGYAIEGQSGTDFECGAWLKSVVDRNDGSLLGLFHGERDCVYSPGQWQSQHNTFFAVSYDQGRQFSALSTGGVFPVVPDSNKRLIGVGNATMVEHNGTLHIYAVDTEGAWDIIHATASVNDPLNAISQGTIGPLTVGSSVTWVGTGTEIASSGIRSCQFLQGDISAQRLINDCPVSGIRLTYIDNFDQAVTIPVSLRYLPYVDRVDRTQSEIIKAVGIVPINGGNRWHNSFYLTYSLVADSQPHTERQMIKRRVLRVPSNEDTGLIRLSSYRSDNSYRTTTDLPPADFTYMHDEPVFLWTSKQSDTMIPVYEVYAPSLDSYVLMRWSNHVASRVMAVIGWVETVPTANTVKLYRTYDSAERKHGVSLDSGPGRAFIGYGYAG